MILYTFFKHFTINRQFYQIMTFLQTIINLFSYIRLFPQITTLTKRLSRETRSTLILAIQIVLLRTLNFIVSFMPFTFGLLIPYLTPTFPDIIAFLLTLDFK